jgi:4-hydroxybenzoate polyprenyltransferase
MSFVGEPVSTSPGHALATRCSTGTPGVATPANSSPRSAVLGRDPDSIPLAIDLDGVLVRGNTLHEGVVQCLTSDFATFRSLTRSFLSGTTAFKSFVAGAIDPTILPFNEQLLDYLRMHRDAGRKIGLFTSTDQEIACKIADHVDLFDVVRGSVDEARLTGAAKLAVIKETLGDRFCYAGDAEDDASVVDAAQTIVLVGPAAGPGRSPELNDKVEAEFLAPRSAASAWLSALRPQHWAKNLLVFLAPILGLQINSWSVAVEMVALFVAMSLMASAAYVINDVLDLNADRAHSRKRRRPFASGEIPVLHGAIAGAALTLAGLGIGLLLPHLVWGALLAYLAIALAYSFVLKRQPIVDLIVLAGLFTLRVLAGGLIPAAPISPWLLTFAMIFFLGLATVKRYAELERVLRLGHAGVARRGYTEKDLPLLLAAGVASSLGAIVIFMVYLITEQYPRQIYGHPAVLWAMLPLILVWVLRLWHIAVHGRLDEDPVVFALRDIFSVGTGVVLFLVLLAAWS